jgi:hypothetical protein
MGVLFLFDMFCDNQWNRRVRIRLLIRALDILHFTFDKSMESKGANKAAYSRP